MIYTESQMDASARDRAVADIALESLNRSGRLQLKVTGTSMLPAISPGSYATIVKTDAGRAEPGDVVLVKSPGGLLLHRFIDLRLSGGRPFVITRGDNNENDDPPVSPDGFLGVLAGLEQPCLAKRWFFRLRTGLKALLRIWSTQPSR